MTGAVSAREPNANLVSNLKCPAKQSRLNRPCRSPEDTRDISASVLALTDDSLGAANQS